MCTKTAHQFKHRILIKFAIRHATCMDRVFQWDMRYCLDKDSPARYVWFCYRLLLALNFETDSWRFPYLYPCMEPDKWPTSRGRYKLLEKTQNGERFLLWSVLQVWQTINVICLKMNYCLKFLALVRFSFLCQ